MKKLAQNCSVEDMVKAYPGISSQYFINLGFKNIKRVVKRLEVWNPRKTSFLLERDVCPLRSKTMTEERRLNSVLYNLLSVNTGKAYVLESLYYNFNVKPINVQ